jgi:prepilin-type N-terminal cleavage/methylation domain-containing protein
MRTNKQTGGFTLVELLTVVAIIALLIGVLIPSLSAARKAARKAATSALIDAVGKGAELFNTEIGEYPRSRGNSPFHVSDPAFGGDGPQSANPTADVPLFGAQWIALQLSGADLQGYVDPRKPGNDATDDGAITLDDWNDWYSITPARPFARSIYVTASQGKTAGTFEQLIANNTIVSYDMTALTKAKKRLWIGTEQVPMYLDAWGRPVLYYRATPGVDQPFTTGVPGAQFSVGVYDQSDNGGMTGSDGRNGQLANRFDPVRFSVQTPGKDHAMGVFSYQKGQTTWPAKGTFEWWMTDQKAFEITKRDNKGKIAPYRRESFILVSAGPDGNYGSSDDVWNFTR